MLAAAGTLKDSSQYSKEEREQKIEAKIDYRISHHSLYSNNWPI